MDFELSPEQREIQALARDFVRAEVEPHAAEWDREHHFPREVFAQARRARADGRLRARGVRRRGRRLPLLRARARGALARRRGRRRHRRRPHERGHAAAAPLRQRRAARALRAAARAGRADRRLRAHRGRGGLRRRRAPHVAPTREDGGWRITGAKQFITTAETPARSSSSPAPTRTRPAPAASPRSCSTPSTSASRAGEEKLGLNSSDDELDRRRRASSTPTGCCTRRARASTSRWRRSTAAGSGSRRRRSGSRRRPTTSRASTRRSGTRSGGRSPSSRRSSRSSRTCRRRSTRRGCSSHRAAWLKESDLPHTEAGAKAKLFASEMARRQTAEAIQILGGYGYTKEFPVERYYRDAKVTEIYEGTSEIQRLVIARSILEPRRTSRPAASRIVVAPSVRSTATSPRRL